MQNNVLDYLNDIVTAKPDKIAFADEMESLTFEQIYQGSRAVGTFLHDRGIASKPVIVFMGRRPKEIVAFLGVVAGGDFYVPVDEEMSKSRIRKILEKVNAEMIICDEGTKETAESLGFHGEIALYDDICQTEVKAEVLGQIHDRAIDTDPVYVVFTSGSTGEPKGGAICHRSVIDYIEQLSEVLEFNEDTVFGNQAPLYFDACLKEIYPTLKFGATAYLIPKKLFMFPVKLIEWINERRINTICWAASALSMVSAFGTFETVKPEFMKTIAFGGEVFSIQQLKKWRETLPDAMFVNLYGPTEGTGMCCYYKVGNEFELDQEIPIGHPFKNTEILLLDDKDKRAQEGEICIRGTAVSLGYYRDAKKTQEVFVKNPLNDAYPELIYRTGDLGRYNGQGELVFVSRRDHQIKHMGHRIELGEVEAGVNGLESDMLAGCIYDEAKGKIILFYVGAIEEKRMAVILKEKLPRYMLPNGIIRLPQMPFTANGKIDRIALKTIYQERQEDRNGRTIGDFV